MTRYPWLAPALLAAGCCTNSTAPVYVETTLARLELPERPTRVVRLSGGISGSAYYVLSRDQVNTAPSVSGSEATSEDPGGTCDDDEESGMFGRIDVCLGKRVSLGYSRRHAGPPMGHLMLYLAGPERERAKAGDASVALSGAWGRDEERVATRDFNDDEYVTRIRRHERDFGLILGLRAAKWAMLYGGPYRLKTGFDLRYEPAGAAAQDSSGDISARGWHFGLAFFAGLHSSWLLEYSGAKVHAGSETASLEHGSFQYQLEFWGKAPPRQRPRGPGQPTAGAAAPGIPATASR